MVISFDFNQLKICQLILIWPIFSEKRGKNYWGADLKEWGVCAVPRTTPWKMSGISQRWRYFSKRFHLLATAAETFCTRRHCVTHIQWNVSVSLKSNVTLSAKNSSRRWEQKPITRKLSIKVKKISFEFSRICFTFTPSIFFSSYFLHILWNVSPLEEITNRFCYCYWIIQ